MNQLPLRVRRALAGAGYLLGLAVIVAAAVLCNPFVALMLLAMVAAGLSN